MRGRRPYVGYMALVLTLVVGGVTAAAPAQASTWFTTAQATVMTQGFPGGDATWTYSQAAGDVFTPYCCAGLRGVQWSRAGGGDSWSVSVHAPFQGTLTPGVYEDASYGFNHEGRKPELQLSGAGGCGGDDRGRFVVNQVELNPDASIKKLDLYFEHWCALYPTRITYGRVLVDVPAPAISSAPAPSVLMAASAAADPGRVRVFAEANAGVALITAHLISVSTGIEAGATSTFARQSGNDNRGIWLSSAPVLLGAPGFYRIDTEISDSAGTTVTQIGAGYLSYFAKSSFGAVAMERNFVDIDQRTSRMMGRLTKRMPGTNEVLPIAGATVDVRTPATICACIDRRDSKVVGSGVTNNDGQFAVVVTVDRSDALFAVYLGDVSVIGSESGQVGLQLNPAEVLYQGPDVFWGPTSTISGRLSYKAGGVWLPMANTTIEIRDYNTSGYTPWLPTETTVTDAQGRFSVSHTGLGAGTSVEVKAVPTDPFLGKPARRLPYGSYQPGVEFAGFGGYWVDDIFVNFLGLLTAPANSADLMVSLQRETPAGWETVYLVPATQVTEGWFFETWAYVACGISRWRAVYGLGYPGGEVYSQVLTAVHGCPPPRKAEGRPGQSVPRRG